MGPITRPSVSCAVAWLPPGVAQYVTGTLLPMASAQADAAGKKIWGSVLFSTSETQYISKAKYGTLKMRSSKWRGLSWAKTLPQCRNVYSKGPINAVLNMVPATSLTRSTCAGSTPGSTAGRCCLPRLDLSWPIRMQPRRVPALRQTW